MFFNVLTAVLSGIAYIVYNSQIFNFDFISDNEIITSECFHFSVGLMQLISGVLLIYALVVIALALKQNK